jgi:ankyrin repeat protein
MLAAQRGRKDITKSLLEKNADPNITDKVGLCLHVWIMCHCLWCVQTAGRSAIFFAVENDQLEVIEILISGGADVDLKDKVDW